MRFGESFGEACRYCGSTHIVVWPPSSAGNCAVCSDEVHAWEARLDQLAERRFALARAAFFAAESEKRAADRALRQAARRAARTDAWNALMRRAGAARAGIGSVLRTLPLRHTRTSPQL